MEMKDLEIRGTGEIESESGSTEILKIRAPIELC
jgi:transcription-repair coupling factor (superfamily II helicase)